MITFEQITKLFSFETRPTGQKRSLFKPKLSYCVEIEFKLIDSEKFDLCWMGKCYHKKRECDVYWFGLIPDGSGAYDYTTFDEMANAPVFDGESLKEVWDRVEIVGIDGCDPVERIKDYITKNSI